jgi:hypothetical protein
MAEKISLERQYNALIALNSLAQAKGVSGDQEAIAALASTIAWIRQNEDAIKFACAKGNADVIELAKLVKKNDAVRKVSEQFPGSRVIDVRNVGDVPVGG